MALFLGVLLFLLMIGGMGCAVYWQWKQVDAKQRGGDGDRVSTAQEFLPFEDIRDGVICLGGHRYRAVIECSSTNYHLKTNNEKEVIEASFQRFLNSLTFPITFFVQTKVMSHSRMLKQLEEDVANAVSTYPHLEEYANEYMKEMRQIHVHIGNNKQKKKYVIVPFDDAIQLGNLSDEEKYEYALKELYARVGIVCDGLQAVGVQTKVLNTKELAELIMSVYHKDHYEHVEQVVEGDFLTLMVEGENRLETMDEEAKLDWVLYEAQTRLQTEFVNDQTDAFVRERAEQVLNELNVMRQRYAGYYQTESVPLGGRDHVQV
ncbi:UNVERIFIED_ORG: hypothetical protein BDK47_11613 [Anoxybacillus amylolyticus]